MHLDVCNWLCTGRIGLGWAHDTFYIACHMFMHSHAYVLSLQYILIYLNCFWDFSDCLSLSLSLLFALICVYGTQTQVYFVSEPTSSNPTPSSIQFCDEDARKAFLENFSRRGIHSESQVILADSINTELPTVVHSQDWESLCDVPVTCPSVLIQEFYSNIHGFDYSVPYFITRVRGMRIVVTPQLVKDVLRVPRVKHLDYPGCERLRTVSKDQMISTFCECPSD